MPTKTAQPSKAQQALEIAREVAATATDWVEFWNALFGITGRLTEMFPTQAERAAFDRTKEGKEIMAMLERLQQTADDKAEPPVSNGEFVLTLSKSLHAALAAEAQRTGINLTALCLAKLSAPLGQTLTMQSSSPRRGREER